MNCVHLKASQSFMIAFDLDAQDPKSYRFLDPENMPCNDGFLWEGSLASFCLRTLVLKCCELLLFRHDQESRLHSTNNTNNGYCKQITTDNILILVQIRFYSINNSLYSSVQV